MRRSIDARQRKVVVSNGACASISTLSQTLPVIAEPIVYRPGEPRRQEAIVVGAGPAGLFAALSSPLTGAWYKACGARTRKGCGCTRRDMARIAREGVADPDSTIASARRSGRLLRRQTVHPQQKRGSVDKILTVLWQHGASEDILVDAHPHIGTDRLLR